eukprot:g22207.t1
MTRESRTRGHGLRDKPFLTKMRRNCFIQTEQRSQCSKSRAVSPRALEHHGQRALQQRMGCEPQSSVWNSPAKAHGEAALEHRAGSQHELVGVGNPRWCQRGRVPGAMV